VGVKVADVARRAGVSVGTVSSVLNRPGRVPESTLEKVETAIADLGYVRGAPAGGLAAHWRRNNFAARLFHPATTGRYPKKSSGGDPVPILAPPWPGIPARGRGAAGRADACWAPIAPGLTPHGLRHTYRTLMDELGTPKKLMDAQMGHEDGSIGARYAHITTTMVERLAAGLTDAWESAVDDRLALSPGSPVAVLDRLLTARREEVGQ
jgi:integrase